MSSRIITVPNLLTIFRMVLIPVFVSLLFYQRFVIALAIFVVAGLTDGLDGLLARRFDQKSQLGTILDPIADKMMMVTSFIVLSMRSVFPQPVPSHLPIPFWVTIAVISRDVFILVGAPYGERLSSNVRLSTALACMTAAVVGVIGSLAIAFGRNVMFPAGLGTPDWAAIGIAATAFVLLQWTRVDAIWVIAGGAAAGLALAFV